MKLKNVIEDTDKLKKFDEYIDNLDFSESKFYKNSIHFGIYDKDNIYIECEEGTDETRIKSVIKEFTNKYWKNFESGIEFHKYDGNYFIEIRPKKNENTVWEFIIESLDDMMYVKFNTNFIRNL